MHLNDAFVVRYGAASEGMQDRLAEHQDESILSFLIALNEGGGRDFVGGGTHYPGLGGQVIQTARGHITMQAGRVYHGGVPIGAGSRYIIVGFVFVMGEKSGDEEAIRNYLREHHRKELHAAPPREAPS